MWKWQENKYNMHIEPIPKVYNILTTENFCVVAIKKKSVAMLHVHLSSCPLLFIPENIFLQINSIFREN